jgi:hypothetical protein
MESETKLRLLTTVLVLYLEKGRAVTPDVLSAAREAAEQILHGLPLWIEKLGDYRDSSPNTTAL